MYGSRRIPWSLRFLLSAACAVAVASGSLACGGDRNEGGYSFEPPGADDEGGDGSEPDGGSDSDGGGTGDGGNDEDGGDSGDGDGVRFDVGEGGGEGGGDSTGERCDKVDFLFVIDDSISMEEEQTRLIQAFPEFIAAIQSNADITDYHIMATWTEMPDGYNSGCDGGAPYPGETYATWEDACGDWCATCPPGRRCGQAPCDPTGCQSMNGAGRTHRPWPNQDVSCGFTTGGAYMTQDEPDLTSKFECAARVGTNGNGNEQQLESVVRAIGYESPTARYNTYPIRDMCNPGFLRDDALLVVTIVSDEYDSSSANAVNEGTTYAEIVTQIKGGNETWVIPIVVSPEPPAGETHPYYLRLWEFADAFTYGVKAPATASSYSETFAEAVEKINEACDEYDPEG
jgi:hypothetical protein